MSGLDRLRRSPVIRAKAVTASKGRGVSIPEATTSLTAEVQHRSGLPGACMCHPRNGITCFDRILAWIHDFQLVRQAL